jgi:hypothetical protein
MMVKLSMEQEKEIYNLDINQYYFKGLDEFRLSKILWIVTSINLSLMSILTSVGIIWFERFGSDRKRICINRIISSVSWATLAWYILVQPADIFLYFYRPLPEWYCFGKLILQNALVLQYVLFYISIIVIRYCLIFCLKNPENFQDDFWYCFLNIWIVTFRLQFQKVVCYTQKSQMFKNLR